MELTQKTVETALYEGRSHMSKGGRKRWSRHVLWDDGLPGFGLRITSTNRKSFIVSYRADGRKRTKTLGTTDKLKLGEARQRAAEFLESVAGDQPRAPAEHPTITGVETVAQLADAYLEGHLKASTPSWFSDQRLMRTHIKPAMGRSRIADVTQTDLANLRNRVARRFPADARRLTPLLTGMFEWAAERGLWSKAGRRADSAEQHPPEARQDDSGVEPPDAAETEGRSEPAPEPLPPAEELAESLRRSEEQRGELAERLDEVSSSGVEMLAKINEQAARHKDLEAALSRHRQELEEARAEAEDRPDPEKTGRQMANLRQSVEQLMASVDEVTGNRDELADKLSAAEARAADQGRKVAALTRSRNKLEERLREEERKGAIRKVQRWSGDDRRQLAAGLAIGAVAGVLLTLLLHGALGRDKTPATPPVVDEPVAAPGANLGLAAADADTADTAVPTPGGPLAEPPVGSGEPKAQAAPGNGEPDFAAAEAAVRSWAAAWSRQRVDDYLAAYSPRFTPPGGLGRGEWASQRRNRILRPSSIRVTLGALSPAVIEADRVRVTFEQRYETPTYADSVVKTLDLAREDGGWKIVAESAG